jgi:hypothetical protein
VGLRATKIADAVRNKCVGSYQPVVGCVCDAKSGYSHTRVFDPHLEIEGLRLVM